VKLRVAALLASVLFCASSGAQAGTILVSGDVNIGNGIDGSASAPIGNNGVFFRNVLGAGTSVLFQTGFSVGSAADAYTSIATLYLGLPGVTETTITTAPSAAQLTGVSLFLSALPLTPYSAADLSVLASYLASGGTVFFLGDNNSVADLITADNNINAALGALGSSVSLALNDLDVGFQTAVGGQILANALTVGVNSFVYAAVSGVAGGTALFNTVEGTPFVAVTTTQTRSVPEPGSLAFIVAGLLGLGFAHRRRGRR